MKAWALSLKNKEKNISRNTQKSACNYESVTDS